VGKIKPSIENEVKQYIHDDKKRSNNPPVGLVTSETDRMNGKKTYKFDPHLEPQLEWAGKAEGSNFDVDTVSLHVHERIDPLTMIQAVKKKESQEQQTLFRYFESSENNPPIREAIEFYKHPLGWSNRFVAGDSLLVMNSLLEKEGMGESIQMIYIDPPYGIKYGSNFQPFINKRDVQDRKDDYLTQEPEMIKAFRDTWELGIHSYLSYLRDRIILCKQLLTESGSIFVQINDENLNLVTTILDELFGKENFVAIITFRKKTMPLGAKYIENVSDHIIWYAKNKTNMKYKKLFMEKDVEGDAHWNYIELGDGTRRKMTKEEILNHKLLPKESKIYQLKSLWPVGFSETEVFPIMLGKKSYVPPIGKRWPTSKIGMENLISANRIEPYESGETIRYVLKLEDFPLMPLTTLWNDTSAPTDMIYVVQTNVNVIARCMLMSTDPGDLILDPTCGSGTSAFVAEQYGRRWITCDTSMVSICLAKQRLMTAVYDYYKLVDAEEVKSGFKYVTVPHVTLGSIANNEPPQSEILYHSAEIDKSKIRISGPFTVEAVPSQRVRSFGDVGKSKQESDSSISRSGETIKQNNWIDEILATGIRGKEGQKIEFAYIESLPGTRWIHAKAETKDHKKAVLSFGPDYAPLEQRQVQLAIQETESLVPRPNIVIFASFQFDPEAAKDIDELKWPGVNVLKVQMNTDLLTSDLKKKRASNESFWLIGQPDVEIEKQGEKYVVTVNGFDYYNTKTGEIESGDVSKIAMWELDTDYDGRSLYPRQVFFPMADENEGWSKLAKVLKAEIDENLISKFRGNISLPFGVGENKQIAVKIIDDRGIESLKILSPKK